MNSTASEETVVLMPELWDLVFNWVGVTEGLANVGRVNHAFRDIVRRQFERRRQNFATRLAEGQVQWKRVECIGSAAPDLQLPESREDDAAEDQRNYIAHSLTYFNLQSTHTGATEPVLARYGGSFPVGVGHNLEVVVPASLCPMLFSPALFFYKFDTATWQRMDRPRSDGWEPEARSGHSAHRINNGAHLLFFGGQYRNRERAPTASHPEGWKFFNDTFLFDLAALAWIPLACKGTPPHPRASHRSVVVGRKLWVVGGCYVDEDYTWHHFADVWTLDLDTWEWKEESVTGDQPRGRQSHSLCVIPNTRRVVLFGGHAEDVPQDLNDCFILDTEHKTWTKVEYANESPDDVPLGRWGHSAFVLGNTLAVLGGISLEPIDQTFALIKYLWVMDLDARQWKRHMLSLHPSACDLSDHDDSDDNEEVERSGVLNRRVAFQAAAVGVDQICLFGGNKDHGLWVLE